MADEQAVQAVEVMEIVVGPGGVCRCVYAEAIDLAALGDMAIQRASRCETDGIGRWWADLAPVGGPRLGPFARRSLAVAAEVDWLRRHALGEAGPNPG